MGTQANLVCRQKVSSGCACAAREGGREGGRERERESMYVYYCT